MNVTTMGMVVAFLIICLPSVTIRAENLSTDRVEGSEIEVRPLQNSSSTDASSAQPVLPEEKNWEETLLTLRWVAYAPTNFDPGRGIFPPAESIREDLQVLRDAGFDGLVTYGAENPVVEPAKEAGFRGVLLGIWDPKNQSEIDLASEVAKDAIVVGLIIGNEGLNSRYDYQTLKRVMAELARETGKPVSTTEELEDYSQQRVRELGDWLCPNVHPYWHNITDPSQAVEWTVQQFEQLSEQTNKVVLLKEVGLPTDGDPRISEDAQAEYYRLLQQTNVHFVYFEAFNQSWKRHAPVEPFWGLFHGDRSPKKVVQMLRQTRNGGKQEVSRALWVWDATVIVDGAAHETLFTFLGEKQIRLIFLDVGNAFIEDAPAPSKVHVSKEALAQFVSKAHDKGIAVDVLDGDANWAKEENHQIPLERLHRALDYNQSVEPKARLDGFQFDIEPYLLPEFQTEERQNVLKAYLTLASQLRDKVVGSSFSLGFAIPFWWDVQNSALSEVSFLGVKKPVAYHLVDILNKLPKSHIAIMAYRDQAMGEDGSIRHSEDEMNYVTENAPNVAVFIGQETADVPGEPEKITFYQEGEEALEEAIGHLVEAFKAKRGFDGIAIHHYESYRELSKTAIPQATIATGSEKPFAIVSPMKGESMSRMTTVQGTAAYAEGRYVEVWVFPYNDQWYLQNGQAAVRKTGEWKLVCYFGNEQTPAGYKFKIKAELKEGDGTLVGTTVLDYVQRASK